MVNLATGRVQAEWDGTHVILTIPSGADNIQVALPLRTGQRLVYDVGNACRDGFTARAIESAEVLEFKKPARRRKGATR